MPTIALGRFKIELASSSVETLGINKNKPQKTKDQIIRKTRRF